jgi:hypothetical protein
MSNRVMKKGKESGNGPNVEARKPTILTPKGGFQHPARWLHHLAGAGAKGWIGQLHSKWLASNSRERPMPSIGSGIHQYQESSSRKR